MGQERKGGLEDWVACFYGSFLKMVSITSPCVLIGWSSVTWPYLTASEAGKCAAAVASEEEEEFAEELSL